MHAYVCVHSEHIRESDPSRLELQVFAGCLACYMGAGIQILVLMII